MKTGEFFISANVTPGMLVRLERISRGLRQVDVAQLAGVKQAEVSSIERDIPVLPGVRKRIYRVLELDVDEG